MSESAIVSRAQVGLGAPKVTVETHLAGGLPGVTLVGLPATAVRESRDRVKSALQNCGFDFPRGRVVVNLAPADLVKEGARFDLAIAVSILCATRQLPFHRTQRFEFLGELSLYGDVRPVRGVLNAVQAMTSEETLEKAEEQTSNTSSTLAPTCLIGPSGNTQEATLLEPGSVICIAHLRDLKKALRQPDAFLPVVTAQRSRPPTAQPNLMTHHRLDNVVGQDTAKRALVVAAAGGHHLLLVGPPGTGKTLLARCMRNLLPVLPAAHAMDVAAIYSAAGLPIDQSAIPLREPHHSITAPAMIGGGTRGYVQPGQVSLAHRGILFLDELPHFKPSVLDLLREPMSNGYITIARSGSDIRFPAQFQLLAAMNPCPAGLTCQPTTCRCTSAKVRNYQSRISGPLLDRIDLQVNVQPVTAQGLMAQRDQPDSEQDHQRARRQVRKAQQQQLKRQQHLNGDHLARNGGSRFDENLNNATSALLTQAMERLQLSARAYHSTLRVARTIADLEDADAIAEPHVAEALAYRQLSWSSDLTGLE